MTTAAVSSLHIYPIKSSAGIEVSNTWIDQFGLSFDRRFVITDTNGQFITARTEPSICLIQASLTASGMILTAPNMPPLIINYSEFSSHYSDVVVWKDLISGQHCHQHYDTWFSKYLARNCQLYFFGEASSRTVKNSDQQVSFADGYPLLLISQASLNELNQRLGDDTVTMAQFRPNIVAGNTLAFAEDSWKKIRIGDVTFEVVKSCSRCIFTTVNPLTGKKHPEQQPLATLKQYRQVEKGDVMFGQNLIALNQGQINQGDSIEVLAQQTPPIFISQTPAALKQKQLLTQSNNLPLSAIQTPTFPVECVKIIDETHDVKTFWLQTGNHQSINYIAGQHLPISLNINDKTVLRNYTLSSSPTRPNLISITVKRVSDYQQPGIVSNYLHDHFKVGDRLVAEQPRGQFHLSAIDPAKLLMLSAGSGITPMLSMLRALVDLGIKNDVAFFHSAHSEKDLIAIDEINTLARQHGNCRLDFTLTRSAPPQWTDYQGRLSQKMLSNIPSLLNREVLVCGPLAFREQAKSLLMALGLPKQQFHFESFGIRKNPEQQAEKTVKKVGILFDSWDTYYKGNTEEPILDQGESAGLVLPYSCRGGMCGSCKMKLQSGEVKQLANDGLTDEEKKQGYILACSCIPQSDIVVTVD
ncbi:flavodoxin [Thalassotalea insulae]|uniref:Flavodoxin n=1 Tax=Thalassotalea insulae TaxID=2056778 RepID=A0ABQ6GQ70_9GAMM|nr:hybrid-cluster NAD(P)-dependent oxidoreductase [Thalassotalea insulae]GLX78026.1 flavodoxin [Thalassotalea insulae]